MKIFTGNPKRTNPILLTIYGSIIFLILSTIFIYTNINLYPLRDLYVFLNKTQIVFDTSVSADTDRETFINLLKINNFWKTLVLKVEKGVSEDLIVITVNNFWAYEPKSIRYNAAVNFQKIWAKVHSPTNIDHSFIKIVTPTGYELGGSRYILGGSVIWIE